MKIKKINQLYFFHPKSKIKAGEGLDVGKYSFYTSSSTQNKWLNESGFNTRALILGTGGKASLHFADGKFGVSTDCFVLSSKQEEVNVKFTYYYLNYNFYLIERGFKGAGLKHISKQHVESIEIKYPSLETQNKIVAILDKAQAIINKREETIQKYDELLRSIFLEMFGDILNNPKGLDKKPLKEFGEIITGNTPPRNDTSNYETQFIEWIKTDNIPSYNHVLTPAAEFLSEQGFRKGRYVERNSLLVTCIAGSIGSIGRCAITDRKVAFNQQINAVVPNKDVSVFYLYWMFKVSAKYIQSFATGGMKRLLTKGEFEKVLFLKPDYQEQVKFEKIAIHYAKLQTKVLNYLSQAEILLKSLSQQVFSEKIIVDIDAELESLINAIDLEKKDEFNKIDTILNDITFIQRLIDRLNEQAFENKGQYDKAKYILFRIMKEEANLIKQVYSDNKVHLTLLNETT